MVPVTRGGDAVSESCDFGERGGGRHEELLSTEQLSGAGRRRKRMWGAEGGRRMRVGEREEHLDGGEVGSKVLSKSGLDRN